MFVRKAEQAANHRDGSNNALFITHDFANQLQKVATA
jgi:hypothetical protein